MLGVRGASRFKHKHRAICEVREKTNKMQQLDVYYQYFLNMFRASLCPSSRRTRRVLLHVVCCAVTSGEKVDISCNVFFVGYCVVNLDGPSVCMRMSCAKRT